MNKNWKKKIVFIITNYLIKIIYNRIKQLIAKILARIIINYIINY